MQSKLPMIDGAASAGRRVLIAADPDTALRETGMFELKGHDIERGRRLRMLRSAHAINELLAAALDQPAGYFTSRGETATWTQNATWYPSLNTVGEIAGGQPRNGPHTDLGTFTVPSPAKQAGLAHREPRLHPYPERRGLP